MKATLKISPTTLETFRSHKEGRYEGMPYEVTTEKLIAYVKGARFVSPALALGDAFHQMLENGSKPYLQDNNTFRIVSKQHGITTFPNYIGRVADRYRELHPDMVHEIKCQLQMSVKGYDVVSNMRIDGFNPFPTRLHDFKTTSKARGYIQEDDYYPSVQWRMYLMRCEDVEVFQYDIFHFQYLNPEAVRPMEYYNFQFFRETDMERVVGDLMYGFIDFCEQHNLLDFITIKTKPR